MVLALDIGNSTLKGGLFDADILTRTFSVPGPPHGSPGGEGNPTWAEALAARLGEASLERVGIASVVPAVTPAVTEALADLADVSVTHVRPNLPLPFELAYETPETLGADRLAAAAAGWIRFGQSAGQSVLVVDAGTAVTYEVVHRKGAYEGGVIAPGPALAQRALRSGTAQLPDVPLSPPDEPVGRSTTAALQSGIMGSLIDGVRGTTARLATALPDTPVLVLTGGWSSLLADRLDRPVQHVPHLVLDGIRLLTATD